VARNRKRAKDRRSQRPARPPASRSGTADAGADAQVDVDPTQNGHGTDDELDAASSELDAREAELLGDDSGEPARDDPAAEMEDETPLPLDSGDAEIAKEQIMLGAVHADEFAAAAAAGADVGDEDVPAEDFAAEDAVDEDEDGDEYEADEDETEDEDELVAPRAPLPQRRRRAPKAERGEEQEEEESPREVAASGHRQNPILRLANFVQGSWRELQRVQWPDRRQVMQATGVVIGFVVVAGVFLGVSDWVAGKIVNWIIG
jgi:preprotein translocase subunit SecE